MSKKITLKTWWKNNYDEPYSPRSVQRLARLGRISPHPVKENGRYMVVKTAKYIEIKTKSNKVANAQKNDISAVADFMSQF